MGTPSGVHRDATGLEVGSAMTGWLTPFTRDPKHGPLPGLLLLLTLVTGLVDAVSILALGRVFVANMTGNLVFLGFAAVGAKGFSLAASLSALAGFLIGAVAGGRLIARVGVHRGVLLRDGVGIELLLLVGALVVVVASDPAMPSSGAAAVAAGVAALAMGVQNAVARRLAVPDLPTTVLTMTVTGLAADQRSESRTVVARRLSAVVAMLLGAVAGAMLVLHVSAAAGMGAVVLVTAGVLAVAARASRSRAGWSGF
jgi:uncharacterized membrane protein YoaK (UPF0700 family)